ncbi:acyltransferase family protein [Cohnella cellulosilytica]|uniref:acyltransferase family protein n=1 Tax=Cohnella cellulosilytica TaxID=986710 RepID=UPI0035E7D176
MFFILSGYVLSLTYLKGKQQKYPQYIIKRLCRLYIPFVVAVIIAIILNKMFYTGSGSFASLSGWINNHWAEFQWNSFINHFLFIGNYDTHAFNGPIWSLVHEMRISIVFPLLMYIVMRYGLRLNVTIAFVLSFIGFGLSKLTGSSNIDFFITLHYASLFIFGALLAKYTDDVVQYYKTLANSARILLFVTSVLLLTYPYWLLPNLGIIHIRVINDWVSATGAIILISLALSDETFVRYLMSKPLLFLGKISYSFYLYHFIIILALLHALYGVIPVWTICVFSIMATFLVASVMYWLVELPGIKSGRLLTNSSKQKIPVSADAGSAKVG